MTEHITEIIIALIGALPPTIMAAAAWRKASKLAKPLDQVNSAVNHRKGGQKRLIEVIDDVASSMATISDAVSRVENDITKHRAWHQAKEESYEDQEPEEDR
jgi:hypothetical protein